MNSTQPPPPSASPHADPAAVQAIFALLRQGVLGQAGALLQQLLPQHPDDPELHRLHGLLASRTGDAAGALRHLAHACRLAPASAALRCDLGRLQAGMGDLAASLDAFRAATALAPEALEPWYFLGITLVRLARAGEALPPLRQAWRLAPDRIEVLRALAEAEFEAGRPEDALPLWQRLAQLQPADLDASLKLGETCSRAGLHAQALASYRQALQRLPAAAELWLALAQAEEDAGDRAAAAHAYAQALDRRPGWPQALAGLLGLQRAKSPEALVDAAIAAQHADDLDDPGRALLGYSLGKVHDGHGRHAAAMACWHDANAARRRMIGALDHAALDRHVDALAEVFDATLFATSTPRGSEDPRPVFVVGMPRSGTTLTEQIIGMHPQAFGCGELPDIALIVKSLGSAWPGNAGSLDAAGLRTHARHYLHAAARHAPASAQRLVDKAPLNYFNLGLIALLFPQARVIWCRRDPRDIALSIYSENFSLDAQFATDLADIGHSINAQVRLMQHWQTALPLPILELHYEQLAQSLEPQAQRMMHFLGLPWDPACLDFHLSQRGVQTPSRWQVREPVHTRSIGRWRNYEADIAPLLSTLAAPPPR